DTMKALNAFYFSFITLSSVGYGDITPATKVTRMLAAMEGITGMLYVAVMIARLVALYSAPRSGNSSDETIE
ncbi:MAG TPA: potassium channel family protein, partial [Candidatus Acidoferrum sp.]|nr:potassium channel family protein [Candidatus Acidoferrum sp.]